MNAIDGPSKISPQATKGRMAPVWHYTMALTAVICLSHASAFGKTEPLVVEQARHTYNLAPKLAFFEDSTNALTVSEVAEIERTGKFQVDGKNAMNRGFSTNTLWAAIHLDNRSEIEQWFIVLDYTLLDLVEAYVRVGQGAPKLIARGGDTLKFSQRQIRVPRIVLPLAMPKAQSIALFFRIKTGGTFYSPFTLQTSSALVASSTRTQTWNGLYFGALSILALYNLLLFVYFRRTTYLVFSGLTLAMMVWYMCEAGWIHSYIFSEWPSMSARTLVVSLYAMATLGLMLNLTFLKPALTPGEHAFFTRLTVGAGIILVISQFVPYAYGARFGLLMVAVYISSSLAVGVRCSLRGFKPAQFYCLSFVFAVAAGTLTILRNVGIIPINTASIVGPMVGVGIFIFMLSIALTEQINRTQRTRDALSKSFAKFVPEKLVSQLIQSQQVVALGGEEREVTVLFSDIRGYSTISEKMAPAEVVAILTEYFEAMQQCVERHTGSVLEYVGDGILAVFGTPTRLADHPAAATRCALDMQETLKALNEDWVERGVARLWRSHGMEDFYVRIGLHTGTVIAGNMGSRRMMKYGIVGDTVNVAARLEKLNNETGTLILLSEEVYDELPKDLRKQTSDEGLFGLKGRNQKQRVYSIGGQLPPGAEDMSSVDFDISASTSLS